jgi:transcriptional regulator with XRE-family HTH domain
MTATADQAKVGKWNRKASQEIRYRLADNLKRLREARAYTQKDLANLCGLNKTYIGNVEQGIVNISLANLEAIAKGLECSAEDLLMPIRATTPGPR